MPFRGQPRSKPDEPAVGADHVNLLLPQRKGSFFNGEVNGDVHAIACSCGAGKDRMKILVNGAGGLIGSSLCIRLERDGHEVVRVQRGAARPMGSGGETAIDLDMARATSADAWLPYLAGIDAVVNCAGALQGGTTEVHASGAAALFEACESAGVARVIHFSAIGVEREQPSDFSKSKLAGDRALMERDLDWVILRPSVVLGRPVFGASALIRGLSALPFLPVLPDTGRLQVVQLDDVIATVMFFLRPDTPARLAVELAGPEAMTMSEVVGHYRAWLGWRMATSIAVPGRIARLFYWFGDVAGWFGWRPPVRSNAAREVMRGATGDPSAWTELTGIRPRSLASALAAEPATVQERWFAGLYNLKAPIFVVLPLFWIATGIISLTSGWRNGVELLLNTPAAALAEPAVVAGAVSDIVVGLLIAFRRTSRAGLCCAILLSVAYAVIGTILRPDLWNEPLGPFLKIFPIILLHYVALAILEER